MKENKKEEYQMKLQDFKEFRKGSITPIYKNPLSEIPEPDMRLYSNIAEKTIKLQKD